MLFSVKILGPAAVEIFNGPRFSINTTEKLQINGSVNGQPDPNITLSKLENGQEVVIPMDHQRITVEYMDTKLQVTINDVRVKDNGSYRIKATNEVGRSSADFNIITQGENTSTL